MGLLGRASGTLGQKQVVEEFKIILSYCKFCLKLHFSLLFIRTLFSFSWQPIRFEYYEVTGLHPCCSAALSIIGGRITGGSMTVWTNMTGMRLTRLESSSLQEEGSDHLWRWWGLLMRVSEQLGNIRLNTADLADGVNEKKKKEQTTALSTQYCQFVLNYRIKFQSCRKRRLT